MGARGDPDGDLCEMKLHGFSVAGGQHEGGAGSEFGAHSTEQIGRLGALIMDGPGPRALPGLAIGQFVLLADPHLFLEPHFYRCAWREFLADFRNAYGKVFLNVSMASASCR